MNETNSSIFFEFTQDVLPVRITSFSYGANEAHPHNRKRTDMLGSCGIS